MRCKLRCEAATRSQASSPSSKLSAEEAAKNVLLFAEQIEIFQVKATFGFVKSAAAAMQQLDQRSASELSAERAAKNVIAFCRADQNLSSKSFASYFQSKETQI